MKPIFIRWWGDWENTHAVEVYESRQDELIVYYFHHHPAWCLSREEKVRGLQHVGQAMERMNVPETLRKWWKECLKKSGVDYA
jgi:hypothetical protein